MPRAETATASLERLRQIALAVFGVSGAVVVVTRALEAPVWLQVANGVVGIGAACCALFVTIALTRAGQRDVWSAMLDRPIDRVARVLTVEAMYSLGVDTEAPDAVAGFGDQTARHAPYVERDLDVEVRAALYRATTARRCHLLVVSGRSKSGKSRTLLEAIRESAGNAWFLVPKSPEALVSLANHAPPSVKEGPVVIWLDDIEPWTRSLGEGLDVGLLNRLAAWHQPVVIAATAGGKGIQLAGTAANQFYELQAEVVAHGEVLFLSDGISETERSRIKQMARPAAAAAIEQQGLGEYMIAAPRLIARLMSERDCRTGPALVWAAVDVQRAGLFEGIPGDQLQALIASYVQGPPVSAQEAGEGMRWALTPLYARTALMRTTPQGYAVHDWVVSHAVSSRRSISPETWDLVVDSFAETGEEQLRVSVMARLLGSWDRAWRAAQRSTESGHAGGSVAEGMLLEERGRVGEAVEAYERAVRMGSGHGAVNLGVIALAQGDISKAEAHFRNAERLHEPRGSSNLGAVLLRRGDVEQAELAFRRALAAGDSAGASNLGGLLSERGNVKEAEEVLRQGDATGSASAAYNLGVLLQNQGRLDEAEYAYRRADARGTVMAASNLGFLLHKRGARTEAQIAYRRAASRGHARAWTNLASLLEDEGDLEAASGALRQALQGGDVVGAYNLGVLCERQHDLEAAISAYRAASQLEDQSDPSQPLTHRIGVLEEIVPHLIRSVSALNLAFLLEDQGAAPEAREALKTAASLGNDFAATYLGIAPTNRYATDGRTSDGTALALPFVLGCYRRADERNSALGAMRLGTVLHAQGELKEAREAYARAEARSAGDAAFALGLVHEELGEIAEARSAYERALGGTASLPGALMELLGKSDRAETTYRQAAARGDAACSFRLGQLLDFRGDREGADAAYQRADTLGDSRAACVVGGQFEAKGDLDGAERAYRRADKRGSAQGASCLGALLLARGDADGAVAAWSRAGERGDPNSASNLGVALQALGDEERAEAHWRRADREGHGPGTYNLGILLHTQGKLDAAKAAYERAADSFDEQAAAAARTALERFPEIPGTY